MVTKTFSFLIIIVTLIFAACNKVTPAGFWQNYKSDLLVKNISDQGPYGGHRAMLWKSDKANSFSSANVLDFAKTNGWNYVDSLDYNPEQVSKWITYNKEAIFPLTSSGFSDTVIQSTQLDYFPRWFSGQVRVYKFKTGWVTIEPGTDDYIEENGFVVINSDRTQMAVYHLWGE
jgi:hypothetical protein